MDKKELYLEACHAYYSGTPIMTDSEFDQLERELIAMGETDLVYHVQEDTTSTDIDDSSFSIKPLESWEAIEEFVSDTLGHELLLTLKMDGLHSKIRTGNFYAQSRSVTNPIDYTEALRQIVPNLSETLLISGESFVCLEDLPYLREKYDTNLYKLSTSAALSLIRTPQKHDPEDVQKLVFVAHNIDKFFPTKSEAFDWLALKGYKVPIYRTVTFNSLEGVQETLRALMEEVDVGYPSDGVVLEVNDRTIVPEINGKYLSTQVALKVDKWSGHIFRATVTGLRLTAKRGGFGTVLNIEPVKTPAGATITHVNGYNIGIILAEKIGVGSTIRFRRKSNGMCVLIYGGDDTNDL